MGVFEQFPYTNFHGVNLSWILEKVRDHETRITSLESRMTTAEEDIDKLQADVGDVTLLHTTDKTSLVAAVNELADAEISYNDLTDKPSINDVTLSGNKTTADLLLDYNDLLHKPIPRAFAFNVPGNSSRTFYFGDNDRVDLMIVGSYMADHAWVATIWQAYKLHDTYKANEIALSQDNQHITFTALVDDYGVTLTNDTINTFIGRVLILQGEIDSTETNANNESRVLFDPDIRLTSLLPPEDDMR